MSDKPLHSAELEHLFRTYYRSLCLLSFSLVKDMDAARDIVQEFFIKYWEKQADLPLHTNFEAYSYTAIKNRSLNFIAKAGVAARHKDQLGQTLYNADTDPQPADTALPDVRERYRTQLIQALEKLPAGRRKVFLLSNVEGLKYAEIAQKLNISINTVKSQIRKAYLFLRDECNTLSSIILLSLLGGLFYFLNAPDHPFSLLPVF